MAVRKKSAQILTGVVPVAWKASSVGQIWSQMKKLIFLKKRSATKLLFSTQLSHSYGKEGKDRAGGAGVVYPPFAPPHRMWWRHPDHHMPPVCFSTHESKNEKRWLAYIQKMDQLPHYKDMKQDISCGRHVTCEKVPPFRCGHCGLTDHKFCNCPYYHPNRKIDCDEERHRQLRRQRTCQDFCVHWGNFSHGILTCGHYQCLESEFCKVRHLPYRSPEIHTQELPGY